MHLPRNHEALRLCEDLSYLSPRFADLVRVGRLCTTTFPPPGSCHMSSIPVDLLSVSNPSNKKRDIASGRAKFLAQMEPNSNIGSSLHVLSIYLSINLSTASTFHTGWIPLSPPSMSLYCPSNHLSSPPWPLELPLQRQHVKNNQGGGCFGSS